MGFTLLLLTKAAVTVVNYAFYTHLTKYYSNSAEHTFLLITINGQARDADKRRDTVPDSTPSSRGGSRRPTTGPATAFGCGLVRVVLMELGKNGGMQNIIPGHPGSFLQPVTLPVNKIFQVADPSTGVQDALYPVDGGFHLDLILDIITVSRSFQIQNFQVCSRVLVKCSTIVHQTIEYNLDKSFLVNNITTRHYLKFLKFIFIVKPADSPVRFRSTQDGEDQKVLVLFIILFHYVNVTIVLS